MPLRQTSPSFLNSFFQLSRAFPKHAGYFLAKKINRTLQHGKGELAISFHVLHLRFLTPGSRHTAERSMYISSNFTPGGRMKGWPKLLTGLMAVVSAAAGSAGEF